MAFGAKNTKVHVARNGAVLGAYEFDKIGDLLDVGQLLPTDHYLDNDRSEWIPLSELVTPVPDVEFKKPEPRQEREGSSRRSRGSSKPPRSKGRGNGNSALGGWIACLFALGAAAGIWAYAANLGDQLKSADEKIEELNNRVEFLKKENQMLNEITPPGRVRGVITYEPSANQVAIMSGATVGLYRRADVEAALKKVLAQTGETVASAEDFDNAITLLKSSIASPIEITLTDSNGRLDIGVPNPGDYVLVASAAKATGSGADRYFWLLGFHSSENPSGLVLMNEKNAISVKRPQLEITDLTNFR